MKSNKILLIVTLILCLALTACGNSSNNSEGTKEAEKQPEATQKQGQKEETNEVVEVSTVSPSDPYLKFDEGETFDKNAVYDAYEKDIGVKITNKWVAADDNQFKEKLKMTIASNDLPDFARVNATQLKELTEADMIMDITDVYDQYATDETKKFLTMDGGMQMKTATFDGKLMGIPSSYNPYQYQYLFVRTDWLKKLNLPEPKTMADLMTIAETFKTKDPGGSGKAYGIAVSKNPFSVDTGVTGLRAFLNGYHAYENHWIEDGNGGLMNSDIQPQVKDALKALQDMFKKGLIDPEFSVKDADKEAELLYNNNIGLVFGASWTPAQLAKGAVVDGKVVQEWGVYPIPSVDSNPTLNQIGLGVDEYYVINKNAAHPEGVIKLLNQYIVTQTHPTEEQKVYEYGKDLKEKGSNYWLLNPLRVGKQIDNNGDILPKAVETKDPSILETKDQKTRYERAMKYVDGSDINMWWEYLISGPKGAFSLVPNIQQNKEYLQNKFYGAPTTTMAERQEILTKKRDEVYFKIIMNQVSVDEFDKFVDEWKKLGGDEITKEVNEWYAASK
ncbi:putative aldouronate transport system substrate-binding protein [Paenibacillus uliginis N3/975]|uniref:Putative aldouronate transport system substrate-binding protein n=1 Tax=Paenibacillus uliginis N3/975 TaxID=1313296 RepID=A0A1X7HMV8_9BACL|nr:extracellular solute-binding protein [Paenibacillus uliginis]SMF89637.1 putative aldouronate transport system substrate-binding protein [Paenibacillus uliginis N3/975]